MSFATEYAMGFNFLNNINGGIHSIARIDGSGNATFAGTINAGAITSSGNISTTGGIIQPTSYLVAALPSASSYPGAIAYVTNATNTAILGLGLPVVGGGTNHAMVYSDGTNWIEL
jgi:hypothetical protein